MSAHIVLLFESPRASNQAEVSIAGQLERAGYEVIEAHSLSMAAALLFVSPALEAVVIDAAGDQIVAAKLADCVSAIRPGVPLLKAASTKAQADRCSAYERADVISTLDGLLSQRDA